MVTGLGARERVTAESTSLVKPTDQQILGPVETRDICVEYILWNHPDVKAEPLAEWGVKNLVPDGIVGVTKIEYTGGGWEVVVSGPVVWKPTYRVEVQFTSPSAFKWSRVYTPERPVQEIAFRK